MLEKDGSVWLVRYMRKTSDGSYEKERIRVADSWHSAAELAHEFLDEMSPTLTDMSSGYILDDGESKRVSVCEQDVNTKVM